MGKYIIIIFALIFSLIFFIPIIKKYKVIKNLGQIVDVKKSKDKAYDFVIKLNNEEYLTKLLLVNSNSKLQINSKLYWQLNFGYNKTGLNHKHERLLTELKDFININANKILIIYPSVIDIKKYINESELKFVNSGDLIYGVRVFNYIDISKENLNNIL